MLRNPVAVTKVTVGELLCTKIIEEEKWKGGGGNGKGIKCMLYE